jgi:lipid-A-disaccharide synthase
LAARPQTVCAAMGGQHLRAAGAEVEQDIDGLAVMGLGPVLARLPEFIRLGRRMVKLIQARRPKVVLTIDYPGFNLRLQRALAVLRADGTRLVHVVAPQVWAWKPRRAKSIAASVDRLLCFFPFEPPLFDRFHARDPLHFPCRSTFVGHPLIDMVAADEDPLELERGRRELHETCGVDPQADVLLLAPGSRSREVGPLLPVLHEAAELVRHRLANLGGRPVQVVVSRVPHLSMDRYRTRTDALLVDGRYRQLCLRARAAVIASGTATLEAALCGLPHIIAYKTDALTALVGRQVLRTPHVGLPNIVLGRRAVPELLGHDVTVERLAAHLIRLWTGPRRADMVADLGEMRVKLGAGGSLARMGDVIVEELERGHRRMTGRYDSRGSARSFTEMERDA